MANFIGKLLKNYKQLECKIFRILLNNVSDHLSCLFQFAWLYLNDDNDDKRIQPMDLIDTYAYEQANI